MAVSGARPVLLGLPSFNAEKHLSEAVESLLAQRDGDFRLTIVDDCSGDHTLEIAHFYARLDPRVAVEKNSRRLGLVGNWRQTFVRSRALHGASEYFAWVGDHDLWHPGWLESLRAALESRPAAVCAYPGALRLTGDGRQLPGPRGRDMAGISNPWRRMAVAHQCVPIGFAVYGLFRATALERCGVYRLVVMPDRLLVSQMAFLGELTQTGEALWYRRGYERGDEMLARQRTAIFPDGVPALQMLPWWLTHAATIAKLWAIEHRGAPEVSRQKGIGAAAFYLGIGATYSLRRGRARLRHARGRATVGRG